ncbi:carboxypeptidase-like regulatory domain-containing protein [Mucilaginibacter psychrotolerans]|nr:carboxypeptidase-like regulatory domain-containing protein [Mucilaginibacter psychrotolerans]
MKRLFLFAVIVVAAATRAHAQTFDGVVKDAKTNRNLEFVNVGIVGKNEGTVTDASGHYSISLTNSDADSLRISMVGYVPRSFLVADFRKEYNSYKTIALQPALRQLNEVKVNNHKWKQVVLGNTTQSQSTNAGFSSNKLGNEIGAIIKIKKSPTYLKQFNASIASDVTDSVKLRLNFYTVKDGRPDQPLQKQSIFVTVHKGDKKITVDLEPYFIVVEDKFFVSLEWIKNSRGHGIMFSASLFSSAVISRETSQAEWEKESMAGVGFNVLAEY